jgi:hypothetical protein
MHTGPCAACRFDVRSSYRSAKRVNRWALRLASDRFCKPLRF